MLSVLDSDKRLADHFGGKMHLGFHELRKIMATWAEQRMQARGPGGPPQGHRRLAVRLPLLARAESHPGRFRQACPHRADWCARPGRLDPSHADAPPPRAACR
jgi:hypothetical protein